MRVVMVAVLAVGLTVCAACGGSGSGDATRSRRSPEPAPSSPRVVTSTGARDTAALASTPRCLPIVSGCGCAYQCARGLEENAAGQWRVVHEHLRSTTILATIERRCFDALGHVVATSERCLDVFDDRSPCTGKCAPTTEYLDCRADGDRCVW